ncbi:hypothetical protein ACOSQ4_016257 [Xanthoceras sorbifolium]
MRQLPARYSNTTTPSTLFKYPRFPDRETEEIRQPHHRRSCRPVPPRPEPEPEPDRSRPLDLNRYDYEYESARKQLSEFNESLAGRQLTSVKYEWTNLMPDKPEKSYSGLTRIVSENENVESKTRSLCLTEPNDRDNATLSSKRYHLGVHGIEVFLDNELSYYKQEKKPIFLDSKDASFPCIRQNSLRGSVVDSIIDKIEVDHAFNSLRDDTREGWMLDPHCVHGQYHDGEYSGCRSSNISRGSQDMEIDGDHSGSRGFLVEHGLEVKLDDGSVQVGEDYDFGIDSGGSGTGSYKEVLYENKDGPQQILEAEELGIQHLSRSQISYDDVYDLRNVDGQCTAEDLEQLSVLNDSGFRETPDEKTSPFLAVPMQEHSHQLIKPSSVDIKKRLGPAQNIKERLGYSSGPFIKSYSQMVKKRPGHLSLPCSKNHEQNKLSITNLDDFNAGVIGDALLDVNMKWSKIEPLEDSQRFEQLVQNAFLKFVKALYENPAQLSKFTKQGKMSTLKCSVCCSNSKEFADTLSLLQHAFMCQAAGLRAEHLGFHRAICVLLGWSYETNPNGFWVRQTLSNAEALAMKEDLIIWPPVVFIHNSSIANANPDERMIVSIEKLKAIIKGMGFDRGISKVCRGKAANQSTMVVNFNGTLSGLQEAEKLHKQYAENKHGRSEFQQITTRSNCTSESQSTDKIKSYLYGYLGIAEDLDKLDFTTKKRCFVKSKKEIQAIAGEPSLIVSK